MNEMPILCVHRCEGKVQVIGFEHRQNIENQTHAATNVSTHTHLVFLGNKVVYDEHLEP